MTEREWLRMQLIGSLGLDPEIKDKAFDVLMDIWIRDYVKKGKAADSVRVTINPAEAG